MKKISIVTMIGDNYGSVLQAYALQKTLSDIGATVETIQLISGSKIRSVFGKYARQIRKNIKRGIHKFVSDIHNRKKRNSIKRFYDEYLTLLNVLSVSEIENKSQADVYLCGSDQIWNPQFQPHSLFYLDFVKNNIPKYSYACSLAVDGLTEQAKTFYNEKLFDFTAISVREETGKRLLADTLNTKEIRRDIDPVLLLDVDYWKTLASTRFVKENYIFLYMLRPSNELVKNTIDFGIEVGKKVIYCGDYYYSGENMKCLGDVSVTDFLSALINADYVITNSFHATAFSVIFQKKFASVVIDRTGSRVEDFLEMIGLEDRILNGKTIKDIMNQTIEFHKAENILNIEREKSLEYLKSMLGSDRKDQ